ncbi:class I adenylate-forming enzyme family protein [Amycolatopsis suaedae]|uniref:Fatty acid--CoA ligase n=1 Tax=Amycolatopsis suaedae TaxID=2510978 RepID=A0A4Q7J6K0_9PSEU|nr:AMP-binding protein [Amycolatopsis suaedae]RZQ62767.1 fatty acid--CoA ligase [Amycolatopsis suaedae]
MPASAFLTRLLALPDVYAGRVAFRHDGADLSYEDTGELLLRLHSALAARDVGPQSTVAVLGGNRPETLLTQIAAQLRGATVLLVAASASTAHRRSALDTAGADLVISDPDELSGGPDVPVTVPPSVRTVFGSGGTTGTPKLIRHGGTYEGMAQIFRPDPAGPNRILQVAPLSHLTGNATALGALLSGDTIVLHEGFDAGAVLRAIETERITRISLTPPRLAAVLDHPALPGTDLSSLRAVFLGASPLPPRRWARALEVFGPIVGQGYGLTEAPMIATITAAEVDGRPERLESVGRIVPGMAAKVVGPDLAELPPGQAGEVLVQGLSLMDGYHAGGDGAAFAGDWLRTGDIGRFDDEGYLYLLDRAGDVIVTGEHGTKVYPAIVEAALATHPGVRQAAVFGVPGPGGEGELVHATVVPVGTPDGPALRAHVRAELGGEHFVPAGVDFAASLPLTPVGKVDKKALRAPFWADCPRGIA